MEKNLSRRSFAGIAVVSAASVAVSLAGCSSQGSSSAASSAAASAESSAEASTETSAASSEAGATSSTTADLIVVGAGAAGLAAAAKAAQGGASVIVLEAEGVTGGTTAICGGHYKFMDDDLLALLPERSEESDENLRTLLDLTAADVADYAPALEKLQTDIQEYLDSNATQEFDSLEMWLVQHYLGVTGPDLDPEGVVVAPAYDLIYPAYANSGAIKDWLVEGGFEYQAFGSNFGDAGGPFSVDPTGPRPQGMAFISILQNYAEEAGAQIITGAKVNALIEDGGAVVGAQTEDGTTYAANQAVLLACGGFASNGARVAQEDVRWEVENGLASCEPASNDGVGLAAAEAIGAQTANLGFNQYQTFPYHGAATIETTIPVIMSAKMAVNKDGVRFRDDSFMFGSQSTNVSLGQPETAFYLIGDAEGLEGSLSELRDRYEGTGDLVVADTIEECAEGHGLDAATVAAEVEKLNGYIDAGEDPDFGRQLAPSDFGPGASKVENAPFFIMSMKEYGQHTMGGVCIDATGHVLDESGAPIEGLFAAGEVVGNLDGAQRRHGDNFAQLLYYGALCGETVAQVV